MLHASFASSDTIKFPVTSLPSMTGRYLSQNLKLANQGYLSYKLPTYLIELLIEPEFLSLSPSQGAAGGETLTLTGWGFDATLLDLLLRSSSG